MLGAKVDAMMRFKDGPDRTEMPQGTADKVMHAIFRIGDIGDHGVRRPLQGQAGFPGLLAVDQAPDNAEAERYSRRCRAARCRCR